MQNSQDKLIEPTNITKYRRGIILDNMSFNDLLWEIANCNTLSEVTSAVDWAYEQQLFIEKL